MTLITDKKVREMEADIAFLVMRARAAGTAYFGRDRWTGTSSNSLVDLAYGGEQRCMPGDRGDYAACVRTYVRLPAHRKTAEVRAGLQRAREAYLANYPDERFPGPRNEKWARYQAERAAQLKKRSRRRRA